MREITYREAVREAMCEEMRRDESVYFMGEDIGAYCGAFGVSKGMLEEFGPERVRETPISESAFVGAGVGSAITGMRPIVELMFSDFMAVCYDQIINQAAKMHFMFAGKVKVPMVIRTPAGGGTGAAAQHSQSLEQMYCNIPGLKVVVPSTPYDAKGLLKSSIRDDNTVIFLEQKLLYNKKGEVPEEEYLVPLGQADLKREGQDVTLITYGRMVSLCLEAADILARDGIRAEVLDLRTLSPLDTEAVIRSAAKCGRVVVVHESVQFAGFGGEVVSTIMESEAFYALRAPVRRVGGLYCPVPFSPSLEKEAFPTVEKILAAVRETFRDSGRHVRLFSGFGEGHETAKAEPPAQPRTFSDVRATPLAAAMAKDLGVDLRYVAGSGYGGKVMSEDVRAAAHPPFSPEGTEEVGGLAAGRGYSEGGREKMEISLMRRRIAERMSESHTEVPTVTQDVKVDVTALLTLREQLNGGRDEDERISVTDLVVKAVGRAVAEQERFRMTLENDAFMLHDRVNIGLAVSVDGGLIVPVIRDVDRKNLNTVSREAKELTRRAREGALAPDDVGDARITVSSLGMYGIHSFTPLINQPEAAIVGVCAIEDELALRRGQVVTTKKMMICVTYDHRIVNGAEVGRFESRVKELLEHPALLTEKG